MATDDPTLDREGAEAAAKRLLAALRAALDDETRGLDDPDFEELARAADGELEASESLLWAERLAVDSAAAERARGLAAFRAAGYPTESESEIEAGHVLPFATPRVAAVRSRPRLGWLAAAAAVFGAVGLSYLLSSPADTDARNAIRPPVSEPASELLFEDGFEGGDAGSWSAVSSSG